MQTSCQYFYLRYIIRKYTRSLVVPVYDYFWQHVVDTVILKPVIEQIILPGNDKLVLIITLLKQFQKHNKQKLKLYNFYKTSKILKAHILTMLYFVFKNLN